MSTFRSATAAAALACALLAPTLVAGPARAQTIHVGVSISTTGPAASLGLPQQKTVALLPTEIGGQKVEYTVLDDGGDSTRGVANMRKLIDDQQADVVIGSSTTPVSMAMIDVAAEKKVPLISLAASSRLIAPMDAQRHWVFKVPQNDSLMADAIVGHMAAHGVKSVAFIGFNDAYGDGWLAEMQRATKAKGIVLGEVERFARTDTSVTGQVLKVMASRPDAVLMAGAGTPAALPQKTLKERGYKGLMYQTHGIANNDFLRVGGRDVEGTILPVGPVVVADQLPDSNPIKKVALDYIHRYEAANGVGSVAAFGAHAWDAGLLLQAAIPVALKTAKPGTPEFRAALRDALEGEKNQTLSHGIATMTADDHNGFDERARMMITIQNGAWKLLP
jgi:branched-chain amino acid transport system substrate-binding protein